MKYQKLTPNLVVRDVAASVNFYCTVLGFQLGMKVPDAPPYVFASVVTDSVEIFLQRLQIGEGRLSGAGFTADWGHADALYRG